MSHSEPIKTLSVHLVKLDKFYYDVFKQISWWPIRGNTSRGKLRELHVLVPFLREGGIYMYHD